jgi:hypothetical protein
MNPEDDGLGLNLSFMLAGLLGSLMMMSRNASQSVGRTLFATIGGAASANYLTPLILDITKLGHGSSYSHAIAFLLGFAGLKAIDGITSKFITDEPANSRKRSR